MADAQEQGAGKSEGDTDAVLNLQTAAGSSRGAGTLDLGRMNRMLSRLAGEQHFLDMAIFQCH
jgi:hypothetical protein